LRVSLSLGGVSRGRGRFSSCATHPGRWFAIDLVVADTTRHFALVSIPRSLTRREHAHGRVACLCRAFNPVALPGQRACAPCQPLYYHFHRSWLHVECPSVLPCHPWLPPELPRKTPLSKAWKLRLVWAFAWLPCIVMHDLSSARDHIDLPADRGRGLVAQ
jgi:hypothetical protein